jgi:hypothetical protein
MRERNEAHRRAVARWTAGPFTGLESSPARTYTYSSMLRYDAARQW